MEQKWYRISHLGNKNEREKLIYTTHQVTKETQVKRTRFSRWREVSNSTRNHAETSSGCALCVPVQEEPVLLLLAARTGRGIVVKLNQLRYIVLDYFSRHHCRSQSVTNIKIIQKTRAKLCGHAFIAKCDWNKIYQSQSFRLSTLYKVSTLKHTLWYNNSIWDMLFMYCVIVSLNVLLCTSNKDGKIKPKWTVY